MLIHCSMRPEDIEDPDNLASLGLFCRRLGREAKQGEVGRVLGNEYFAILAEVESRFRVPAGGGRATDPEWTERRLVPLTPQTLERLEAFAAKVCERSGVRVQPMQLAGLLLERSARALSEAEASELLGA